jgi:hypothetical protein
VGEAPEKKTGVHQFVDVGPGPHIYSPRMQLELLATAAIVVISIVMFVLGTGEGSTQVHTPPQSQASSQASCALARARELGISPSAVRREFAGQDLCGFSFHTLTPAEQARLASPHVDPQPLPWENYP